MKPKREGTKREGKKEVEKKFTKQYFLLRRNGTKAVQKTARRTRKKERQNVIQWNLKGEILFDIASILRRRFVIKLPIIKFGTLESSNWNIQSPNNTVTFTETTLAEGSFRKSPWWTCVMATHVLPWVLIHKEANNQTFKKVSVEPYSLVSSAKRYSSPDFTQLPLGYRTCLFISHLNSPGSLQPGCDFSAYRTIQTHKPSLSYQVPYLSYSWVERVHVWAKCLA